MQLYKQLKNDIETKLKAGTKLPSIRKLSNDYNLSKTTVQSAYNQLYAEGYIESKKIVVILFVKILSKISKLIYIKKKILQKKTTIIK